MRQPRDIIAAVAACWSICVVAAPKVFVQHVAAHSSSMRVFTPARANRERRSVHICVLLPKFWHPLSGGGGDGEVLAAATMIYCHGFTKRIFRVENLLSVECNKIFICYHYIKQMGMCCESRSDKQTDGGAANKRTQQSWYADGKAVSPAADKKIACHPVESVCWVGGTALRKQSCNKNQQRIQGRKVKRKKSTKKYTEKCSNHSQNGYIPNPHAKSCFGKDILPCLQRNNCTHMPHMDAPCKKCRPVEKIRRSSSQLFD